MLDTGETEKSELCSSARPPALKKTLRHEKEYQKISEKIKLNPTTLILLTPNKSLASDAAANLSAHFPLSGCVERFFPLNTATAVSECVMIYSCMYLYASKSPLHHIPQHSATKIVPKQKLCKKNSARKKKSFVLRSQQAELSVSDAAPRPGSARPHDTPARSLITDWHMKQNDETKPGRVIGLEGNIKAQFNVELMTCRFHKPAWQVEPECSPLAAPVQKEIMLWVFSISRAH